MMKRTIIWNVKSGSIVDVRGCFRGKFCLHFQDRCKEHFFQNKMLNIWWTTRHMPQDHVLPIMRTFVTCTADLIFFGNYIYCIYRVRETELVYDWWFTTNQFVLTISPLRLTTSNFIFWLNTCGYSPYVTSSLTRGWVCSLQLLLALASAVTLRSESRGSHDYILVSQIRDCPNLEGQVPVFIFSRNRVAQLYPQALGSLFVAS
jgi:hypothetical protein